MLCERPIHNPCSPLLVPQQAVHRKTRYVDDVVVWFNDVDQRVQFLWRRWIEQAQRKVTGIYRPALSNSSSRRTRSGWSSATLWRSIRPLTSSDIRLLQVQSVQKAKNDCFLAGKREVAVFRLCGSPVPQQVKGIHVVAGLCQRGDHDGPIAGARTQAMDQHNGHVTLCRRCFRLEIVNVLPIHDKLPMCHVVLPQVQIGSALHPARTGRCAQKQSRQHPPARQATTAGSNHFLRFEAARVTSAASRIPRRKRCAPDQSDHRDISPVHSCVPTSSRDTTQ